jgi:hypothetical protein
MLYVLMPRCSIQWMMKYTRPPLLPRDVRIMATGPRICPGPGGRVIMLAVGRMGSKLQASPALSTEFAGSQPHNRPFPSE